MGKRGKGEQVPTAPQKANKSGAQKRRAKKEKRIKDHSTIQETKAPELGKAKTRKRKELRKKEKLAKREEIVTENTSSPQEHMKDAEEEREPTTTNALTDGDDFIPFNFDDDSDVSLDEDESEDERPTVFAKVAEKLGKFVKESNDPNKRKRQAGDGDSKQSRKRKREIAEKDPYPWLQGVSYAQEREPARILHREILDFVKFVGPTEEEHQVRRFVISRIRKLVELKWPTASLHVFGSFETKLYLPTSDIDLVVLSSETGECYEKPNHLRRLANWLVKAGIAQNIQVIASARVPIIKFIDSVTKINIDISFNKPSGLIAASVVKSYTDSMPALRPLVVFIKHFLNMRGMNEVFLGGLGSYSITCMVISFLQRHPKIATGQISQEENLGVLVVEFFELYGKRYNYDTVGININGNGKYFNKIDHGWQRPGQSYLLSIEDPTDSENDIARSSFGILKVKSTFGGGHDFLVQRLYDVNDRIKDDRRAGLDSVLSSVVSIDEDMKESRRFIATCFESEVVQSGLECMGNDPGPYANVKTNGDDPSPYVDAKTNGDVQYVAVDSEVDDALIDDDGHAFVRPEGYKQPSHPGDVDDLYAKLNGPDPDTVYLIESSDDDINTSKEFDMHQRVIDLDTDAEEDSRVAQVNRSTRARYWEAKGQEEEA